MRKGKRKPIFVYFILMVLLFVILFFAQQIFTSLILNNILSSKNGISALGEIIWAGLVLIIVLIFGNKYIFTQEKEKYFKSLKYIMPELILSFFFFLFSVLVIISSGNSFSFGDVFNLALLCLFIGIVEEFLCRGWLFNEFLERYSDSRKNIIMSIIFSSLIFGFIHFFNVDATQGVLTTSVQVINATVSGIFFALVYYKTKNIWVVVTGHALWDFTLMLNEISSLGSCVEVGSFNNQMLIYNCLKSVGLSIAYLLFCYWIYRKTDLYLKENAKKKNVLVVLGIIVYLFSLFFLNYVPEDYYLCPDYTNEKLNGNYKKVSYVFNDDDKKFELNSYPFEFALDKDKKLFLKNTETNSSIELASDVVDYVVVQNKDDYTILIQNSINTVLFGKYNISDIKYNENYLKDVKDNLKLEVGPNIGSLGVIEMQDDGYKYSSFSDEIGNILYFNKEGNLKINK